MRTYFKGWVAMIPSDYRLVRQRDLILEEDTTSCSHAKSLHPLSKTILAFLAVLLLTSLSFNALLAYLQLQTQPDCMQETPTSYAGLIRNVALPFVIDRVYDSRNRTVADEAWKSLELVPETGLVALSDDWVSSKGLPEAQRFPWNNSKGLYVLNGFHSMHCLHMVRQSTLEAFDGMPQTVPRSHISHCINLFREDIMCNADDTPRYTGRLNQQASAKHPISGIGQTRLCKDWGKLRKWAIEHSACYKAINIDDPDFPPVERYKFCPNGEKLWP